MEIFTEDESTIKYEIEELITSIPHLYSKTEIVNSIGALKILLEAYELLGHDIRDYERNFNKNISRILFMAGNGISLSNKNLKTLIKNEETHLDFINNFFTSDKEVFVEDIVIDEPQKLDQNQKYEIFIDFLLENNPSYIETFESLIKEKRIHEVDKIEFVHDPSYVDSSAYTIYNLYKENFHIIISKCRNDITQLASLSHENGHIIDCMQVLKHKNKKAMSNYIYKNHFIEVISSMYEKEFLEFARKSNIDKTNAIDTLQTFYLNIYTHFNEMNLLHQLPKKIIKTGKYKEMTKQELYDLIGSKSDILVEYDDFPSPTELDYEQNICYGYGKALGTYFSSLKRKDKDKFEDVFSKFLDLRTNYFHKDIYIKLGITPQEVSKTIEEEISSANVKIYIK